MTGRRRVSIRITPSPDKPRRRGAWALTSAHARWPRMAERPKYSIDQLSSALSIRHFYKNCSVTARYIIVVGNWVGGGGNNRPASQWESGSQQSPPQPMGERLADRLSPLAWPNELVYWMRVLPLAGLGWNRTPCFGELLLSSVIFYKVVKLFGPLRRMVYERFEVRS